MYLEGRGSIPGLFNNRFMRARVMRFDKGATILNIEEVKLGADPKHSVRYILRNAIKKDLILDQNSSMNIPTALNCRVMMEVQFAGENSISIDAFKQRHYALLSVNATLSGIQV